MERLSLLYANALFNLSLENGAVQEFFDQAIMLRESLKADDCRQLLVHPHISAVAKHKFFKEAFAAHIHRDLLSFLFLAADKNREAFIVPALAALIELIERHNNIVTAKAVSATPLDESQISVMKTLISEKLGKTINISLKIDPTIIGGPHIYVDGYYIDWTVRKRMRDLAFRMKEGCSA
jgi:F-type H+-transporting ATPase subunit delta